ncbi:hypothetical protein EVAR_87518_1 [Eumeta japonica]|uniref:Uncharacterized protein n=1 Tax=Eumeta variegata TaxID=151549 RepID=A0A4C1XRD1_EUMVA|nr:hypothetical protein EVAR_87518_1 [Eumeta japonica]
MTFKCRLQRPQTARMSGDSIWTVSTATVLRVFIYDQLSFAQYTISIGEKAAKNFGKMSKVSEASWCMSACKQSLLTIYLGTFLATVTYTAGCWYRRAGLHVVRSALLRTQRPALTLLTKIY